MQRLPALGLIAVTAVWGSTFVLIKGVVDDLPVLDFLAVRFTIAAAVMLTPRIGDQFDAVVTGVTRSGTFVRLRRPPSEGRVRVRGRIAPMIELGAGFNPDLTGLENIVLYGTLLGRDPSLMRSRATAIAEWAELVDFLDVPVRSYSSGMLARLAFSVAVDTEPDVLIVDEVLSVGDESFQRRSLQRIEQMIGSGTAVVLVSHSMTQVLERASRVVWLERGRIRAQGAPAAIVAAYRASQA